MAQKSARWCDRTHGRAICYKAVRDGIVWDGLEARDVRVALGAAAAWCRNVCDGAW